jgi:energy-coupling factor transporter ATP-binding protein EcfA2
VPIRDTAVIAVEGTNASGKTTLVHGLTSHLRERSLHAASTGEPARTSPFMEEISLHGQPFDLVAEVDLFAQHLTGVLRAARHQQVLITDKTPLNVLAHAELLLDTGEPRAREVLNSLRALCRVWMPGTYDVVVYCRDQYDQQAGKDRMRDRVSALQQAVDTSLFEACTGIGVPMVELPTGLTTAERIQWITREVAAQGMLA